MKTKTGKINIITLGCAKNTVDSEALYSQLLTNDFSLTEKIEHADIAIINTCGFIDAAKRQSVETILSAVQRKNEGNLEKVFVMGCLSERYSKDLSKEIPEVDRFFGTNQLPDILEELGGKYKYELLGERAISTPHHFAYLKISEGCDNPCSFCAIPIMRGGHRTKPVEHVMDETMRLVEKGVKELIIIGQDTTYYGLDLYGERKLASLLASLASIKELEWIRLMYAYPAKFPLDVLQSFSDNPKICRYLDMPVQHAADNVLKSMRRGVTRRTTENLIAKIRESVSGIALRTTLIVGYPNETEKDFDELVQFVKDVKFDRLGVFTYSQEDQTSAFDLGDTLPQEEKERRKEYIMEVQREISLQQNESRIGKKTKAVLERTEDGNYVGRTEWDAPEIDNEVFISANETKFQIGQFLDVTITDATEFDLYAETV
ncbi:MAG: 30S ribosomal protein S12 methylthiotransferase RimO [Ignavibacteriales bacterium]|nr:30S ribosomal protein S12 methylthiotransferase RimO [Ignavibacteriales bacterium]